MLYIIEEPPITKGDSKCSLELGNQWSCSLIKFWTLFSQGLMGKSMDLLEGSRSLMEGERESPFCFGRSEVRKKRQSTVGEEGEGYKYPLAPTVT